MRRQILIILMLSPVAVWAQGACPAGLPVTGNHCYFVAANGNDSNDGLSELNGHPWQHAWYMPGCTGTCGSTQPGVFANTNIGFIFRGGDTWHFGNSGASPYTGGSWTWTGLGSQSGQNYLGVDQTWFTGASWTRPILNGDNATSTSPVGSCSFHIQPATNNINQMLLVHAFWTTVDNFEFTGMCQDDTNASSFPVNSYLNEAGSGHNNSYLHLYFHGWTATAFSCSGTVGRCFNMFAMVGETGPDDSTTDHDVHLQIIVDGSDSVPNEMGVMFQGGFNVSQSVFRYATQIVTTHGHLWHDNLFEHWYGTGDQQAHPNLYEESGSSNSTTTHAYYNNVFRNICTDTGACPKGLVGIWPQPNTSTTDYFFNNIVYNADGASLAGNFFNIGQNGGTPQGTVNIFNNTWQQNASSTNGFLQCTDVNTTTRPMTAINNHYIGEGVAYPNNPAGNNCASGQSTITTELLMTNATATSNGYTNVQTYAYSPTSSGSPTVGAGTNKSAFCNALSTAAGSDSTLSDAARVCPSDTSYACTYNTSNHTVSCPVRTAIAHPPTWSIGDYEFSGGATSFTFSVAKAGAGNGTFSGTNCASGTYNSGTSITCNFAPSAGTTFIGWTGTGSASSCTGTGACSFSLTSNSTATANTSAGTKWTISGTWTMTCNTSTTSCTIP